MKFSSLPAWVYFLLWVGGVWAVGAALGSIAFPLAGWLFQDDPNYSALAREGARRVGFIFFIWAPAIGIAASVMRAHRRRARAAPESQTSQI
jgi:hypothetical protein